MFFDNLSHAQAVGKREREKIEIIMFSAFIPAAINRGSKSHNRTAKITYTSQNVQ